MYHVGMKTRLPFNERVAAEAKPRFLRAAAMRARGLTYREIGEKLGVTRQRAEQLAKRGFIG